MNNNLTRKLAKLTIRNGKVDKTIVRYVLSNLTRKELIMYLAALKKAVYESSVRIVSAEALPQKLAYSIRSKFKGKVIFYEQDKSLGAGIKIIINDTSLDLTIDGYLNSALEQLKI